MVSSGWPEFGAHHGAVERTLIVVAEIVLINPRFEASFWGLEHAMPLFGKKANLPVACLPLLAALTPPGHRVTLIDENVEPIDFDRIAGADVVGVTGMSVQRFRMREILIELKQRGVFTVVGGPWVTVREDYFGDLADVIFIGEADETWPQFLNEWKAQRHARRYEQAEKTDMSRLPTPRFDLLRMRDYLFGSLQISRGCPFQCEFCDIIVTFGRRPRLKTSAQFLAEVDALHAQGMQVIFIVDDNLIGNKRAIKPLLRNLIAWQKANGYPLTLFTEASLDLAEDPELLRLMVDANFISVFVGIESPNEASLRETKKHQNVRKGVTLLDRVHAIQGAGLEVWCGMILGFDHDDAGVFDAQRDFIRKARIPHAMMGMLAAIPKTPLHARLAREGRLDHADTSEYGTNVIPLLLSREDLRQGYLRVMNELYEPGAYFARVEDLYLQQRIPFSEPRTRYLRSHPWRQLLVHLRELTQTAGLCARLLWHIPEARLRLEYLRRLGRLLRVRRDPGLLLLYTIKCAMHYHHYRLARQMAGGRSMVNSF
jgi:radical SAM superfamily enzyme YgiQ (UPF0313 family)